MRRELRITEQPINEGALVAGRRASHAVGGVIQFTGTVRCTEGSQEIAGLAYECFREMAERQFALLFDEMEKRWPVESVRLIHRVGNVPAGETSLWVEIASPHRHEAFAACQWLIDEMKKKVPIWKKALPRS